MRVYALARELGIESSDVLGVFGGDDLRAASSLSDDQVALVREHFTGLGAGPSEPEKKQPEDEQDEAPGYYGTGGTLTVGGKKYRAGDRIPDAVVAKLPVHVKRKLTLQSAG